MSFGVEIQGSFSSAPHGGRDQLKNVGRGNSAPQSQHRRAVSTRRSGVASE